MITTRPAELRDLEAINRLIVHARAAIARLGIDQWQDGYPEPELIESDIEQGIGRVFLVDGNIAAYLVAISDPEPVYDKIDGRWITEGLPYLTIHRMAIDDGYRGTGLSVQMFSWAQENARTLGLASLRADTHRGNLAMRGLLNKCGFEYCGEVTYEVSAGDPIRVAYEKKL